MSVLDSIINFFFSSKEKQLKEIADSYESAVRLHLSSIIARYIDGDKSIPKQEIIDHLSKSFDEMHQIIEMEKVRIIDEINHSIEINTEKLSKTIKLELEKCLEEELKQYIFDEQTGI